MSGLRMIALDLSLAATGVAWSHDHHGRPGVGCRTVHTARTRHGATDMDHARVHAVLSDVAAAARCRPDLVVIEWLPQFDGHSDAGLRLAELHGVIKHWIWTRPERIPYVDVRPVHLKQWATGKGNSTKSAVKAEVIATYGGLCHVPDDNAADAVALLSLALAAYGQPIARVVNPKQVKAIGSVKWPSLGGRS